jgi:hypothetical protein
MSARAESPFRRAYWRRGVYVHWWGPGDAPAHALRVWWAVVLESDGWLLDGVWLPRYPGGRDDHICLYRRMHFGPEQLRLPARLAPGQEAELLERARREWIAAAVGGYLPDAGKNRTVRVEG